MKCIYCGNFTETNEDGVCKDCQEFLDEYEKMGAWWRLTPSNIKE